MTAKDEKANTKWRTSSKCCIYSQLKSNLKSHCSTKNSRNWVQRWRHSIVSRLCMRERNIDSSQLYFSSSFISFGIKNNWKRIRHIFRSRFPWLCMKKLLICSKFMMIMSLFHSNSIMDMWLYLTFSCLWKLEWSHIICTFDIESHSLSTWGWFANTIDMLRSLISITGNLLFDCNINKSWK